MISTNAYWFSIFGRCLIFAFYNIVLLAIVIKLAFRSRRWNPMQQLLAAMIIEYAVIVFGFFLATIFASITPAALIIYALVVMAALLIYSFCLKEYGNLNSVINSRSVAFYMIVLAIFASIAVNCALSRYPSDMDSLNYHIPLPVNWVQSKSLFSPLCMHWSCPGNNELIGCWLLIFFDSDFLIGLNNLPSIAILTAAVFLCIRQIGFSSLLAFGLTILALSNEVAFRQVCDQENDVAVAAFFLSSLFYGIRFISNRQFADLMISGIAFGLLSGVKYYALGYSCLLLFVFLLFSLRKYWTAIPLILAVFALSFSTLAAYWYIRNYFASGLILYPFSFLPDLDLSRKAYPGLSSSSIRGNAFAEILPLYLAAVLKIVGPFYFLSVLLFPVIGLLALLGLGHSRRTKAAALYRLVLQFGALGVFVITPFAVEDEPGTLNQMRLGYCPVRYSLPFLLLSYLNACCILRVGLYAAYGFVRRRCQSRAGPSRSEEKGWLRIIWAVAFCISPVLGGCIQGAKVYLFEREELVAAAGLCAVLWLMIFLLRIFQASSARPVSPVSCFSVLGFSAVFCFFFSIRGYDWEEDFVRHYQNSCGVGITRYIYNNKNAGLKIGVFAYQEYGYYCGSRKVFLIQPYYLADEVAFVAYLIENKIGLCIGSPNGAYLEGSPFRVASRVLKKFPFLFSPLTLDRRALILYRVNEEYFDPVLVFRKFLKLVFPFAGLSNFLGNVEAEMAEKTNAWIGER